MSVRVAVLKGGWSAEREVSLVTGAACAKALRDEGYEVGEIDVDRRVASQLGEAAPDVVFNALHGQWGEDGCVQGLLELLGLPYTHSGVRASALAMHKPTAREIFMRHGIPCPDGLVADIDGPVHEVLIALWNKKSSPGCMLTHMHAGDDRYVTKPRGYFYGGNYMSSDHQGVIGGVVGELEPRAYLQEQTSLEYTWYAGGTWIARTGTGGRLFVFPWSDPKSETLVTSSASDPEGLVATSVVLHGDAVFFDTTSSFQRGINVFTPTEGAQPFIR